MNRIVLVIILGGCFILNSCSLHFLVNRSNESQALVIRKVFADPSGSFQKYVKREMTSGKGVTNLIREDFGDSTTLFFLLIPGRSMNISSLVFLCGQTNNVSELRNNTLLIKRKGSEDVIDTILFQKGSERIVNKAKSHNLLFWKKYYYNYQP